MRDALEAGFKLVLAGFAIAFLAVIILSVAMLWSRGAATGGVAGCIVIGFIPICFGVGKPEFLPLLMIAGLILMLIALALLLLPVFILRKAAKRSTPP
jgi:uncharacterized membrane protein